MYVRKDVVLMWNNSWYWPFQNCIMLMYVCMYVCLYVCVWFWFFFVWILSWFLEIVTKLQNDLGDHYQWNPLEPEPPTKKVKKGGDPEAFATWIKTMIKTFDKKKVRVWRVVLMQWCDAMRLDELFRESTGHWVRCWIRSILDYVLSLRWRRLRRLLRGSNGI